MEALGLKNIIAAIVYSGIGLTVLGVGFYVFDKITPGNLWTEIRQEKNVAVAIVVGAMALAIAQIIGSAIHG